jgi:hypothetical protein
MIQLPAEEDIGSCDDEHRARQDSTHVFNSRLNGALLCGQEEGCSQSGGHVIPLQHRLL